MKRQVIVSVIGLIIVIGLEVRERIFRWDLRQ